MPKRRLDVLVIGALILICIGLPLMSGGCALSSSSCSITADDVEIHLSSGGVTCTDAVREMTYVAYFRPGGLTGTSGGIADPAQVDCVLILNGQTATVSYGSTFGLASEADEACSALIDNGWVQQ